jgi:glycosyltransferase involved in cell wall biosynthesis
MSLAGKRVLYISYNGMLDPLGQSQVIPYLKELSKLGVQFTLLSFEREQAYGVDGEQRCKTLNDEFSQFGIKWHRLRYHQRPSIPATAFDVVAGIRFASRLVRRDKIELVHARAHIPAVIALNLKRRFGTKMIFDVRGLMAEEYIDAGHWQANSVAARITKNMEARVLRATHGIVTLTDALWTVMREWPALNGRSVIHETIPCCIDQELFRYDPASQESRRDELGISDRFVLVYSGSVGGWYMTDEMAAFFAVLKQQRPDAFFLWLTTGPPKIVEDAMARSRMAPSDYAVRRISNREVGSFLSAAEVGIAFYRPGSSRLGTSPVKVSEYLSCGLPVVINSGIGDTDDLIEREKVGVVVKNFKDQDYSAAASAVLELAANTEATRQRVRATAEKELDLRGVGIDRYARLYERVLAGGI